MEDASGRITYNNQKTLASESKEEPLSPEKRGVLLK
jgi:hypothetical protein